MSKTVSKPPGTMSARTEKSFVTEIAINNNTAIAGKENGRTCAVSASDLLDSG